MSSLKEQREAKMYRWLRAMACCEDDNLHKQISVIFERIDPENELEFDKAVEEAMEAIPLNKVEAKP